MKKNKNQETGEWELRFSRGEWKKFKIAAAAGAAVFAVCAAGTAYMAYAVGTLRAENDLYRNQLQMSNEKMQKLTAKLEGMEKITDEVRGMMGRNGNTQSAGGAGAAQNTGGAATVPDRARTAPPDMHTPGDLLHGLTVMEDRAEQELQALIGIRSDLYSMGAAARFLYGDATHATPSAWPVEGSISSTFGWRQSPGGIGSTYHEGVDISTDYGTPVHVTADGTVTRAAWEEGYGYLVEVRHADGFTTRYGHNSAILVYEGQNLRQGDTVALAGSTGNSTGPHSHYEVRLNGTAMDPALFLNP